MTEAKKTPELAGTSAEGSVTSNLKHEYNQLAPRLKRLALALLDAPHGLPREACDRATPCSNSPEYLRRLRERLGLTLPCIMVPFVNSDGQKASRGIYKLTPTDRQTLSEAMS